MNNYFFTRKTVLFKNTFCTNLHLLGFADAAVGMDVGDVYRGVSLIAANAASDPHPQGLPGILPYRDCLLRQLRPLDPQRLLEKLRHFRVGGLIICTGTSCNWSNGGKFGATD